MRIFIKYNSKVFLVGRLFLLLAKGGRSPRVVWVLCRCMERVGDQKNGFRDKFIQEKYFKENFEASWTISFKIRAKIDG